METGSILGRMSSFDSSRSTLRSVVFSPCSNRFASAILTTFDQTQSEMVSKKVKKTAYSIRKTSKGLKRAFCPLKPLKLCFKAIKSLKIFKTRISLKFLYLAPFFFFKKIKRDQAF